MKIWSSNPPRTPPRRILHPRESSRALRKLGIETLSTPTASGRRLGLMRCGCPMRSTLSSVKSPPRNGHIRFGSSIAFCTTTSNESGVFRRRKKRDGYVLAGAGFQLDAVATQRPEIMGVGQTGSLLRAIFREGRREVVPITGRAPLSAERQQHRPDREFSSCGAAGQDPEIASRALDGRATL